MEGAPTPAAHPPGKPHNQFLDLIRTVAIIRVLAWHTYGFAWLSYLVASMPAMFFVAGSLMAHSLERASAYHVLVARFRRLLIPLWAFALVVVPGMALHSALKVELGRPMRWEQLPWWIFPAWDPQGSDWGVTFWAVLWYMRCLTWLILLSPLLLWLFRRISIAVIGIPLGFVVFFELRARAGHPVPWQFEDLAVFSIFWLLGFAYNAGLIGRISTRVRAAGTFVFAAAAALWVTTQDVPGMVVNASYPAHLLVGLAWLGLALTFEVPLRDLATRPAPARFVAWVNDRVFTIYLWHAAGLFVMYELLWAEPRPDWLRNISAFPIVLAVTFACMLAFGWIEDFAARRELHIVPRAGPVRSETPRPGLTRFAVPAVAGVGVVTVLAGFLVTELRPVADLRAEQRAVPPSGVGIALRAASAVVSEQAPSPDVLPAPNEPATVTTADLQAALDRWRTENGLAGTAVAIAMGNGSTWEGVSGDDAVTGQPLPADYVYPTASVTKTFTVALILQLVEEGKVDLDAPVSRYVPGIAHDSDYTVRELIQHRSGLMATDGIGPADALIAATRTGLAFEPGTGFLYSSPGYYMLGLVVEKVTGVSYTVALHERLLDPLGLSGTAMDEEISPASDSTHPQSNAALRSSSGVLRSSSSTGPGKAAFEYHGLLWSSAGLYSTVRDIAAWGLKLYDSTDVVSENTRDQMTNFLGPEFQYAGLGTYPFCPCWKDGGRIYGERWGHYGRSGVMEYEPAGQISLAIYTSGTDIDERLIVAYDALSNTLRDMVRGRTIIP